MFLLLLRNIVEKDVLEQNVWKTSASETDVTKRTQEMRQTWRSKRLSGLSSTFWPHVSKHWEHVCVCIPLARRHFSSHMFDVRVELKGARRPVGNAAFSTCLCLFWLSLPKRVSSGSGEADDGVRGASGCRWRLLVQRRGVRLHPQSAVHFQRRWDFVHVSWVKKKRGGRRLERGWGGL